VVSWHEALAYCAWLQAKLTTWTGTPEPIAAALAGRRDGVAWRITLPSEAEWERAARGIDAGVYPWGTDLDPSRGWYGVRKIPARVGTHPAGASPVGAMDMVGNVSEWTRSMLGKYPYALDDGRERLDAPDSGIRMVRGGSFDQANEPHLRPAARSWTNPDWRVSDIGFRLVFSRLGP
jgi:formylglycine-generating enzyme required for sulfatase activity